MNNLITASLILALLSGTALAAPPKASPIVVELFTSEGCSSCPPADALLSKLRQAGTVDGAEVLILGEHVDYWNHLGWTDRFSSAAFSERQNEYARRFDLNSAYTPQMVIDGHAELVGNDEGGVHRQIALAARSLKPAQIKLTWNADGKLQVEIDGSGDADGKVLLAITEDGLSTQVGRGENGGRLLQHSGVVRELREIGSVRQGKFSLAVKTNPHADWKPENLRAVVFVQKPGHGDVLGAASLAYASSK
jgi:hypothetical protein